MAQEKSGSVQSSRKGTQGSPHSDSNYEGHYYCDLEEESQFRVLHSASICDGLSKGGLGSVSFAGEESSPTPKPHIHLPALPAQLLEIRQGWHENLPQGSSGTINMGSGPKEVDSSFLAHDRQGSASPLHTTLYPSLGDPRTGTAFFSGRDSSADSACSGPEPFNGLSVSGELSELLYGSTAGAHEFAPDEEPGDEWFLGMSSASDPKIIFHTEAPRPPRPKSFHPLAKIATNDIHLTPLIQAASLLEDTHKSGWFAEAEWISAIEAFCFGSQSLPLQEISFTPNQTTPITVSRGFTSSDIEVLKEVVSFEGDIKNSRPTKSVPLTIFKVDKSDGVSARLVADCRILNKEFVRPPAMGLPPLDIIFQLLKRYKSYASVDAMSYFFQFPLSHLINAIVRVGEGWRGKFMKGRFSRLIMGLNWAPFIAQQTSWALTALIKAAWSKEKIEGDLVPWVDNFLIFSNDMKSALDIVQEVMDTFNVVLKKGVEEDLLLGFKVVTSTRGNEASILSSWALKAQRLMEVLQMALQDQNGKHSPTLLFQQVAGHLLWANQIARIPLCLTPALLENLRRVGRGEPLEAGDLLKELPNWNKFFPEDSLNMNLDSSLDAIWTDASDTAMAYVIPTSQPKRALRVQTFKAPQKVHIFYKELVAAALGVFAWSYSENGKVALFCDNMAVASGIAKGHFKNKVANEILRTFIGEVGGVIWVPSRFQLADRQTRHAPDAISLFKEDAPFFKPLRSAFSVWGRGGGSIVVTQASAANP